MIVVVVFQKLSKYLIVTQTGLDLILETSFIYIYIYIYIFI